MPARKVQGSKGQRTSKTTGGKKLPPKKAYIDPSGVYAINDSTKKRKK